MELHEVLAPHVAIPVVCVLLCAFLVFAFGFKAPVQPPSFDFYEDDRRQKKNKKVREKPKASVQSNGQVHINQESKTAQKSQSASRHRITESETKSKSSIQIKAPVVESSESAGVEDDQGEWTTFISRKEKKNRNKKEDDDSDKEALAAQSDKKADPVDIPRKSKKGKKATQSETMVSWQEPTLPAGDEGEANQDNDGIVKDTCMQTHDDSSLESCDRVTEVSQSQKPESGNGSKSSVKKESILLPAVVHTPSPDAFDITIDIQSVERKSTFLQNATPPKSSKTLKKTKKDKKEKEKEKQIPKDTEAPGNQESLLSSDHSFPSVGVTDVGQEITQTPSTEVTHESNRSPDEDSNAEGLAKTRKKKARKDI